MGVKRKTKHIQATDQHSRKVHVAYTESGTNGCCS